MKELKTLKDFDLLIMPRDLDNCPSKVIEYYNRDLKAEAVKWVKAIRNSCEQSCLPHILGENPWSECFIYFFNLTEEDLK